MSLISGKEALSHVSECAVQYQHPESQNGVWTTITDHFWGQYNLGMFLNDDTKFKFRLKPRTISINGIEVPCCGENYQYGDAMYILNSLEPEEYSLVVLDKVDEVPAYWWKTEDEIKQVVAALRGLFRCT